MASSSDVVKKVTRFKLQLTDAAESATVLKILQKLKDLDITLDILAETGIGRAVNSLRRHEQAGEFAKSLVRGWKKLVPKDTSSHTGDGDVSEMLMSVKDKLDEQNCPNNGSLTSEDLNNNCLKSHTKSQDVSDEAVFKTGGRKTASEKQRHEQLKGKRRENREKNCQENIFGNDVEKQIEEDKIDDLCAPKKKNHQNDRKSGDCEILLGNKNSEETQQRSRRDSREKPRRNSDSGGSGPEKESTKKSKDDEESVSLESSDKYSLKLDTVRDDRSSEKSKNSKARKRKRHNTSKERHVSPQHKQESESKGHSKHKSKKAKIKHKDKDRDSDQEEPSKSFESYLNYDMNVLKRKEQCGPKKPPKKIKTGVKEKAAKEPDMKLVTSPVMSVNVSHPKQKFEGFVMDLMNVPLPAVLPECDRASGVDYTERKVLYETGGVPFEILEPVLERCTPEQLLRIEEFNPIYIGVTDHLWGKHCQRDFKDSTLQEYESWKEMYIRLSEERERKLQRLTKSIVSAHSQKPKGRQVKMAFIHTVAKPPRDVRIQQEIHGTAVQQPHQPRCSVKVQDNRVKPSCNEPSRPSSSSSGGAPHQNPAKKQVSSQESVVLRRVYLIVHFFHPSFTSKIKTRAIHTILTCVILILMYFYLIHVH
ncbi:hypothetical protein INR49_021653 [Caranx melampygus]|nr:hypothetical protein INR49_021653 [Caranx melampygus]